MALGSASTISCGERDGGAVRCCLLGRTAARATRA